MRSRAVLLPTPADPFQLYLWFEMFKKRWGGEVDKLYVNINSAVEPRVIDFIKKFMSTDSRVEFITHNSMIGHGEALKELLNICKEDYVVLLEDDCIIFKSGSIEEQFQKVERKIVDIVGSHRQSSSRNIAEAALKVFHYPPDLEQFLWPNLLFIKKDHLLKTDQNFGTRRFEMGEVIPQLGWRVDGDVGNDTFVWASIQLKGMKLKVEYVEQYHAMAEDISFYVNKERAFSGKASWVHLGSLSSILKNFLFYENGRPFAEPNHPNPIDVNHLAIPLECQDINGKQDIESRFANVKLAFDFARPYFKEIEDYCIQYERAYHRARTQFGLDSGHITAKINIYKELYQI